MPTIIESVHTYATLGEIMQTLSGVFGKHVETPVI
jgi:methylmalonyl-CoA mutase, N-terminal domain